MRRISRLDIPGGGQVTAANGYAYIGHLNPPAGTSIVDIRDPKNPRLVGQTVLDDNRSHTHKVRVLGDLMIVNVEMHDRHFLRKGLDLRARHEEFAAANGRNPSDQELAALLGAPLSRLGELRDVAQRGYTDGGFRTYDISDKSRPRLLAHKPTGGVGVHRFDMCERYAYISTEMDGYKGNILVNYDITNPEAPEEVSRWWMPGQHVAGGETPHWDGLRYRLHHALRHGDELWAACWYGGARIIDIADIAKPKTIGEFTYHPPYPEPTHTFLKVPHKIGGRDIAVIADEEHPHDNGQPHAFMWVVDVSDYNNIKPISQFHVTDFDAPWARSHLDANGQYGHDIYGPGLHQFQEHVGPDNLLFCAWFSAGLRAVDISNPEKPKEVASFLPDPADGCKAPQTNDVFVDERGLILTIDRENGLDILELT